MSMTDTSNRLSINDVFGIGHLNAECLIVFISHNNVVSILLTII